MALLTATATTRDTSDLPRKLGLTEATSVVVGTVIGIGIFLVPSSIARHLPSTEMILVSWLIAGVVSFFGALAYAELGAMMPRSGGQYVYLGEAYGPLPAFVCGWTLLLVTQSGGMAIVSVGFSIYLSYLLPSIPAVKIWAPLALIGILTAHQLPGGQGWGASTVSFHPVESRGVGVVDSKRVLERCSLGVGMVVRALRLFRHQPRTGHAGLLSGL